MTTKRIDELTAHTSTGLKDPLPDAALFVARDAALASDNTRKVTLADIHQSDSTAIRTWLPPYNVVGDNSTGSAATNVAGINQAIADAETSLTIGAPVLLPQGIIYVDAPIVVGQGTRLYGQGAGNNTGVNSSPGTVVKLAPSSDCNVIEDAYWVSGTNWWHWGEIAYMRIDGNKSNQTAQTGSGIAIYQMGEACMIRNVMITSCSRYGFETEGNAAPMCLRNVTANSNDLGGFYYDSHGAILFDTCSGDSNSGALFHFEGGGGVSLTVLNAKHENNPDVSTPAVLLSGSFVGNLQLLGGSFKAITSSETLIRCTSGTPGNIKLRGVQGFNYTNIYEDDVNSRVYPWPTALSNNQALGDFEVGNPHSFVSGVAAIVPLTDVKPEDAPKLYSGTGTPEGAVTARIGSLYLNVSGGASTTLYVKTSGTGNTGWTAK